MKKMISRNNLNNTSKKHIDGILPRPNNPIKNLDMLSHVGDNEYTTLSNKMAQYFEKKLEELIVKNNGMNALFTQDSIYYHLHLLEFYPEDMSRTGTASVYLSKLYRYFKDNKRFYNLIVKYSHRDEKYMADIINMLFKNNIEEYFNKIYRNVGGGCSVQTTFRYRYDDVDTITKATDSNNSRKFCQKLFERFILDIHIHLNVDN